MTGQENLPFKAFAVKVIKRFFDYETPKLVHIMNKRIGVLNRILQLIIVAYIVLYVILYKKGYQEVDAVVSGTTTKVKGIAWTNYTALKIKNPNKVSFLVWDVADYVVPPLDPEFAKCRSDSDCKAGVPVAIGNGVQTGSCVTSSHNASVRVCEIYAWCPVEINKLPVADDALLQGTENFTVMIKNNIEFPKFRTKSRNVLDTHTNAYLRSCIYDGSHPEGRLCPVFRLGSIVNETKTSYKDIAILGGVIKVNIDWNCDLDYDIKYCFPVYSFTRLDAVSSKIAQGTNFRYADYYEDDGGSYRDLYKAHGILFIITVTGQAGKFGIFPLFLNIGSGIGLLAVTTVLCDIIALYLIKQGRFYKVEKFQTIVENLKIVDQKETPQVEVKQK